MSESKEWTPPVLGRFDSFFSNVSRVDGYLDSVTKNDDEFEAAWTSCKGRLHAWIAAQTSPHEDPDAIFQEVWLSYLRAIKQGRTPRFPRAWLFAAARRLVLKGRRRRAPHRFTEEPPARITSAEPTSVEAAIERLSPTAREVFILRVRMGLTYDEIAQVLEIPRGTVASRLHDAVTTLRRQLTAEGFCTPKWRESR